jgi:hypothetical protein
MFIYHPVLGPGTQFLDFRRESMYLYSIPNKIEPYKSWRKVAEEYEHMPKSL